MNDNKWLQFPLNRPKLLTILMVALTIALGVLMVRVKVDTDPENMLAEDEAVRIFHHQVKKEFSLHDVVVLGVVNEKHPDGVFNPETLGKVLELSRFAQTLADPRDPSRRVVTRDVIAPDTVDAIEQAGLGQVRFDWLMPEAPADREAALAVRDKAMTNPLFKGTLVSEDGQALAIYLPITAKDYAFQLRKELLAKIAGLSGDEQYYITGLPVAEDTFGVEMFIQMAISAPLAMMAIFLLMLLFFRQAIMVIAPMIVAMVTVICTMGLMIGAGHTVHIMSSMIPIFLMPIAVVDSVHILSEFFDTYQKTRDRRQTIETVMGHLFKPMLYTSVTSATGFASLALAPIPPVQVFGLFVAFGIMLAWLLTILFIPAYVMMLKEESLAGFGVTGEHRHGRIFEAVSHHLRWLGGFTFSHAKLIVVLTVLALGVAAFGISRITVNDNPMNWFTENHDIRQADRVLNAHFGGTYEAYLVLEGDEKELTTEQAVAQVENLLLSANTAEPVDSALLDLIRADLAAGRTQFADADAFLGHLAQLWDERSLAAVADADYEFWSVALDRLEEVRQRGQVFKQPEVLRYIARLENYIEQAGTVGKTNTLTDVVKKVHQELFEGNPAYFRVPDTPAAVAQTLISFQNSHKPDDLWHLVTPDYRKANLWVQLKKGDNKVMEQTIADVETFFRDNPPPVALSHQWAGLTYINVVWQEKMVFGMMESFLSSFAVVFVLMAFLFRSLKWGLLAMIPMTVTIAFIYGLIGLVGKDYDMPVAVLSSLTLGLAVDFAIHFLQRARAIHQRVGTWEAALKEMFAEPARAITRNVVVIAVGFTPLLFAPLMPYKTVGFFLAAIMAVSGLATMFMLPAAIRLLEPYLFKKQSGRI